MHMMYESSSFCSYAELIADWPVVVLGVCTVLIVVCALVGILVPDLPDFSNPLQVSTRSCFGLLYKILTFSDPNIKMNDTLCCFVLILWAL